MCRSRSSFLALVSLVGARHLLVQRRDVRREKPVQSELVPLLLGERRPLVQDRHVEDLGARRAGTFGGLRHVYTSSWARCCGAPTTASGSPPRPKPAPLQA